MNKVILLGRLTRDPDIRYTNSQNPMCVARYTLAVDRRRRQGEDQGADFISCVAFGKAGEHAEKYFHKGIKICVTGRIQTGSYDHKDGYKVYTTDVVVEEQEFAESRASNQGGTSGGNNGGYNDGFAPDGGEQSNDGFVILPDDSELPWSR